MFASLASHIAACIWIVSCFGIFLAIVSDAWGFKLRLATAFSSCSVFLVPHHWDSGEEKESETEPGIEGHTAGSGERQSCDSQHLDIKAHKKT